MARSAQRVPAGRRQSRRDSSGRNGLASRLASLAGRSTLRLTTRGRKTGKKHTVTVWFLVEEETIYLVTMNLARDWPRNLLENGQAELEIGRLRLRGTARIVRGDMQLARIKDLLAGKYWLARLGSWFGLEPEGAFEIAIARVPSRRRS